MPASPRLSTVQCLSPTGLHRMAYHEWGEPDNPQVLVCAHGLSRTGRDFDALAQTLSTHYRVVCPDIVGRGQSDWLPDPMLYSMPQYVSDMVTLLARLNVETVAWLGTSMGGLIGMSLAGLPHAPICKLLLNDIGPTLNATALQRIGDYLGLPVRFKTFDEGLAYLQTVSATFGPHTPEQWRQLNQAILKPITGTEGTEWRLHYDPAIAVAFGKVTPEMAQTNETFLWQLLSNIQCETLIVRGADSDLLTPDTLQKMLQRNPHAHAVEIPHVGHAPTFMQPEQIAIAAEFFLSSST